MTSRVRNTITLDGTEPTSGGCGLRDASCALTETVICQKPHRTSVLTTGKSGPQTNTMFLGSLHFDRTRTSIRSAVSVGFRLVIDRLTNMPRHGIIDERCGLSISESGRFRFSVCTNALRSTCRDIFLLAT